MNILSPQVSPVLRIMSTTLLDNLVFELNDFTDSGDKYTSQILQDTSLFIGDLKLLERELELQVEQESSGLPTKTRVELNPDSWYKKSISSLKSYNTSINKLYKHVLNNSKYTIDLDDAYTYPLLLDNVPAEYVKSLKSITSDEQLLKTVKHENQQELSKAIVLHLLKIGQSDLIMDMLSEGDTEVALDQILLDKFKALNNIVDKIMVERDLSLALEWLQAKGGTEEDFQQLEFKFHVLQYTLLLNGGKRNPANLDSALDAYMYSKKNFPRFFGKYIHELSPLMSLLLFKTRDINGVQSDDAFALKHMTDLLSEFMKKMKEGFSEGIERSSNKKGETKFVDEILRNFDNITNNQGLFQTLSNEFTSYYCKDLHLSNDSSLFQCVLSGYINLPNFYKYNNIQRKFSKMRSFSRGAHEEAPSQVKPAGIQDNLNPPTTSNHPDIIAPYSFDLPFQLPDVNLFLFSYHPIFICPVTKEQSIPLTIDEKSLGEERRAKIPRLENSKNEELVKAMHNPVVVLKYCQHVALKESVWQLSKRGSEMFRCHYCYKKHKFNEVEEAFFIDL